MTYDGLLSDFQLEDHGLVVYFAFISSEIGKLFLDSFFLFYLDNTHEIYTLVQIHCIKPAFTPKTAFFGIDLSFIK